MVDEQLRCKKRQRDVFNKLADDSEGNINGPWSQRTLRWMMVLPLPGAFWNGAVMFIEAAWSA